MKKILVTGANGFIGNSVVNYFERKGNEVWGWVRKNPAGMPKRYHKVDVLKDEIESHLLLLKPDIIIHCLGCANVGKSIDDPLMDFEGNTIAVYKMMEAIRKCDLRQCIFIHLSSAAVYGQPESLPVWEGDRLKAMSPYSLNKRMAEEIVDYYRTHYGIRCRVVRVFSAYGEGLKKQIFWDMFLKIKKTGRLEMYGNGDETRDFIHIDDLVNALYLIAMSEYTPLYVNLANGKEITIRYVAEQFADYFKIDNIVFNGKIKEGDPRNWKADISVIKSLGYKQTVEIDEGIRRYCEWVDMTKNQ